LFQLLKIFRKVSGGKYRGGKLPLAAFRNSCTAA
jgi:hypothetical protein